MLIRHAEQKPRRAVALRVVSAALRQEPGDTRLELVARGVAAGHRACSRAEIEVRFVGKGQRITLRCGRHVHLYDSRLGAATSIVVRAAVG